MENIMYDYTVSICIDCKLETANFIEVQPLVYDKGLSCIKCSDNYVKCEDCNTYNIKDVECECLVEGIYQGALKNNPEWIITRELAMMFQ